MADKGCPTVVNAPDSCKQRIISTPQVKCILYNDPLLVFKKNTLDDQMVIFMVKTIVDQDIFPPMLYININSINGFLYEKFDQIHYKRITRPKNRLSRAYPLDIIIAANIVGGDEPQV